MRVADDRAPQTASTVPIGLRRLHESSSAPVPPPPLKIQSIGCTPQSCPPRRPSRNLASLSNVDGMSLMSLRFYATRKAASGFRISTRRPSIHPFLPSRCVRIHSIGRSDVQICEPLPLFLLFLKFFKNILFICVGVLPGERTTMTIFLDYTSY